MQMTKQAIATDLRRMLAEDLFVEISPEKIQDTDSLSTDLGLDSVGQIELVSLLEERYGLKIETQSAAAQMQTVGSTTEYVWKHLNGAAKRDPSDGQPAKAV